MIQKKALSLQSNQKDGVLAQLVERLNGIQKVRSSILLCSTNQGFKAKLKSLIFFLITSVIIHQLLLLDIRHIGHDRFHER